MKDAGRERRRVRIGISTCPNDVFAFDALMRGEVRAPGLDLEFACLDVEALNEGMAAGRFDVAKVSYRFALEHGGDLLVLPSGSALGFGNGPLLLAGPARAEAGEGSEEPGPRDRVLGPGASTTAALLYESFHPASAPLEHTLFSSIMPRLESGDADYGVCIHEGRFTYRERGLRLVRDLGSEFEARTGSPLPLGGIVAARAAGEDVARRVQIGLRASLELAQSDPSRALPAMRRYAAELDDDVLMQHVALYVNERTANLGPEGRGALAALAGLAERAGIACELLEVLGAGGRLFHAAAEADWAARPSGPYAPPSLAREGFVHLSYPEQLEETLRVHFGGVDAVALLELDPERAADALLLEPSRGGALFPHLYRPIADDDVAARHRLARSGARFELPSGLL